MSASPFLGEVEADESYFGPRRVRGKRGRGASGKTIVFGLLKRGDEVYTEIVPNASKAALQAVIRGKVGANGIPKHTFYLHLKETEFRFNHRNHDLYKTLLSCFRIHPL